MDPISAAGIGLGVASLALELFAGCVKAYDVFLKVAGMPESLEYLRVRLHLEQSRLLDWGDKIGLLEETLEGPSSVLQLHRNIIIDILVEKERLFKSCMKVDSNYSEVQGKKKIATDSPSQPINDPPTYRKQQRLSSLLAKTLKVLEKTPELPTRLEWALVKRDRFESLIEKLISYNNSIVSLLDRADMNQLLSLQLQSQLTLLQLCNKVDDLSRLSEAIHMKPQSSASYPADRTVVSDMTGNLTYGEKSTITKLLDFKAYHIMIENSSNRDIEPLDRTHIILLESGLRTLAKYKDQHVWIEWKEYDPDHPQPGWAAMIEDRVKRLTALFSLKNMPVEFRAPKCVGYFHDNENDDTRYAIVYERPDGVSPLARPITLLELIRTRSKPSLTKRVSLALSISESIMYLHSVDWLHKGLRSNNILYFVDEAQEPQLAAPILCGFEYARPDLPDEMTEMPVQNFEHDIYRHPDALRGANVRSKKSWDIYSLGIVLIEIACWQTIDVLMELTNGQGSLARRIRTMRNKLVNGDSLEIVGGNAGEIFQDVVQCCLDGENKLGIVRGSDESDPIAGADMLQAVANNIVGKLRTIQA